MKVFDYIYYRIAKFYFKRDGSSAFRAISILSILQCLLFSELIFFIIRIYVPISETEKYSKLSGNIGVAVALIFLLLNYLRYKGKYWQLSERWKNSDSPLIFKLKGLLVVLVILLPFIILVIMSDVTFIKK